MKEVEATLVERTRKSELIVYAVLWLIVLVLPFFNEFIRFASADAFSWSRILRWFTGLIPFIVIFLINNFLLVPHFLLKKKMGAYVFSQLIILGGFILLQDMIYDLRMEALIRMSESGELSDFRKTKFVFLGLPMPLWLNLSLLLLLMAVNTSIIVVFKYIREREKRSVLENMHLQDELRFLKTQINPHFFMNTLNSIHAMIELDPIKAQSLTIELSKMMRTILYDGANYTTTFAEEIRFLESYVTLFRHRYPTSKVSINMDVPENPSEAIILPPMIFVTFVENAFKHGVSYKKFSSIEIKLTQKENVVTFMCRNTKSDRTEHVGSGIGLENVRRRLDLLYSDNYTLNIENSDETYNVELIIPGL